MKIHKGDTVLVISGKDRKKTGKVLDVFPKERRIIIEGISMRKKHVRPKKSGEKGQMVQMPSRVSASNVKLICPKCGKPARVGYKIAADKKYRMCKKCKIEL